MNIINMISGPRNLSTAMMYSFNHRTDFNAIDEPFYAYYLKRTDVDHPAKKLILESQSSNWSDVISEILAKAEKNKYLFVKNMAHHLLEDDLSFLKSCKNFFLIRNPKQLIASFSQVISNPSIDDIGLKHEFELFEYVSRFQNPVVLDSGELLKNPEQVLKKLCVALEVPFDDQMLHWPKGEKNEDGIWAPYWYKNVHQTTGFQKQKTSSRILDKRFDSLYANAKIFYDQLFTHSIKAD